MTTPAQLRRDLGVRIQALRQELGLTQVALAERAGISNEFLSRIEHGTGTPSLDTLAQLAHAIGIDIAELFPAVERTRTPEAARLERVTSRLSAGQLDLVIRLAEQVEKADLGGKKKKR